MSKIAIESNDVREKTSILEKSLRRTEAVKIIYS